MLQMDNVIDKFMTFWNLKPIVTWLICTDHSLLSILTWTMQQSEYRMSYSKTYLNQTPWDQFLYLVYRNFLHCDFFLVYTGFWFIQDSGLY